MPDELIKQLKHKMEQADAHYHHELSGIRTGRASSALVENIQVEVYGSKMPINQVATISVPESRLIVIQLWDQANTNAVRKAIESANLGLNPMADGGLVRINMPDLNEERRKEMVKIAHQVAERAKVAVRNIRRDGMDVLKKMQKDAKISEDEMHDRSEDVQKLTDEAIKKIDAMLARKEKDILDK